MTSLYKAYKSARHFFRQQVIDCFVFWYTVNKKYETNKGDHFEHCKNWGQNTAIYILVNQVRELTDVTLRHLEGFILWQLSFGP